MMIVEDELLECMDILSYLRFARKSDKYFVAKLPAILRRLSFYVHLIKCEELRTIIKKKAEQYVKTHPISW